MHGAVMNTAEAVEIPGGILCHVLPAPIYPLRALPQDDSMVSLARQLPCGVSTLGLTPSTARSANFVE